MTIEAYNNQEFFIREYSSEEVNEDINRIEGRKSVEAMV